MQVRFYVIEKASGRVVDTHYTSPACLVFHHINAYEEDGNCYNIVQCHSIKVCIVGILLFVSRKMTLLFNPLGAGHIVVDVCALEDGGVAEVTLDSLGQSRSPGFQPKSRCYVLPLGGSNEVC